MPPNIRLQRGKAVPRRPPRCPLPPGLRERNSSTADAQGSSAAGTGQPGHLWSVTPVLSMDHSVIYMILLCFTIATHSSNLDSCNFFFLFFLRCCDCDSHWGLYMLGRNLLFGGDHTHLGMPAVLWAHGPEGEACGRPYSASLGVLSVCLLESLSLCLPGRSLFGGFKPKVRGVVALKFGVDKRDHL